ncbi:maltose alpha-D-glucosyltransferase [Corynebacterium sp. CMW7794]|uniref:maltose alpha-D-glucosyltransferase n=1 Tax=Corynebacterium TaxID=1716 RepID=UPI000791979A|nr:MULTISPECIES: maltose alpha-D-glucosyltransferase [Corynebacterium]KXI18329.1 maltose alpha-D-glucosyltransferase [Corynebacterium sp. CMW7794]MBF9011813.1 maltose alpha-D-glucosyltransferase [Corynebacterium phoceense]OFL79808.1 trehalose synthase [Corynebacterium sp. HMSC077B05]OFN44803.1 trehalose synthase [Corynebacterium sp. HMSC072G08]OFP17781.1 trehalose synthase [Corynebacterium sp. HMSC065A05]
MSWFHNAIFYQALLHAFNDSNGDGMGDLRGVTDKLDYLEWLGVDCLWLPPMFDSPMRDDGYDIADYRSINPRYGTMSDFEELLEQAHARGIRVITDLALNHTSDQHYWFQESRRDPAGPYGDYYVWGDDPTRYPEIRIIFTDYEISNWAWDEERGQYYFHRFYTHQPDLNYDCPAVQTEIFDIVRFWMDKGLDGFRLDAIPYLFERDGQGGESLPETFAFLERLRAMVNAEYPEAMMIAEANQPPRETMEYFGSGNRVHMVFNFPVMPKIFEAVATGSAEPLYDILDELPPLPADCQWGTFLRNHDELTLEMASPAARTRMYDAYAKDPRAKANVGIARRLAPLMEGDRRKIELLFSLLMTLPGAPFIYYGDEIGMGDDVSLPDRYAVRTPMQWEPGPGAGFSTGETRWPIVGGEGTSVAEQQLDDASLLMTVRGLIAQRKAHPELGTAPYEAVETGVEGVFGFQRGDLLCLHNFTDADVDLGPVELGPYGYAWVPIEEIGDGAV